MKINWSAKPKPRYFTDYGCEVREGDTILMDGKYLKVYETEDGELGTDATNPKWIEVGKAVEGEFGIYPFDGSESCTLVAMKEYKGSHHLGEIVNHRGHECVVTVLWVDDDGRDGISIKPTGNYGFEISIYEEQL